MSSDDEVRRRVQQEVDTLSDYELRTFRRSRSSLESWIHRTAYAIGRMLSAPIRSVGFLKDSSAKDPNSGAFNLIILIL
jgi:hypothetical protein